MSRPENANARWGSWADMPQPIADADIKESIETEVVILGAGISGVAAALRCAQNGLLVVVGGLRVNERLQVIDKNLDAIEGLYAVGNTMGGRYGVDYPLVVPGNSHGTSVVMGYMIGEFIAEKK